MGLIDSCSGDHNGGIEFSNKALRLDPFAPDYLQYLAGAVHFNARNYEEAVKHLHATQWLSKPELLSATYVHIGRLDEARRILASHTDSIAVEMKRMPDDWFTYYAERCPYVSQEDIAHYCSGLEAALE
jgi:tetratricopeptide (TPR) repeat protein